MSQKFKDSKSVISAEISIGMCINVKSEILKTIVNDKLKNLAKLQLHLVEISETKIVSESLKFPPNPRFKNLKSGS